MTFNDLMVEVGKRLSVELAVHDGTTQLVVDDMEVSVLEVTELDAVVLNGVIGEPPPQGLEPLYRAMLEANYSFAGTAGATLAVSPDGGELTLTRLAPLATLDVEGFLSLFESFVNVLETWRKIVADYRPAVADSAPSAPSGEAAKGGDWMMPV